MRIVLAGGSGRIGSDLARTFTHDGHEVMILSRRPAPDAWTVVQWDGRSQGRWTGLLNGADVVINLAGATMNCRYTPTNRRLIMDSRIETVHALGQAIAASKRPPRIWLQMSTANIYAHRFDTPNDEITGIMGGGEVALPETWRFSVSVASAWEKAFDEMPTPNTRKVALRTAPIMSAQPGGAFDMFSRLARLGGGGRMGTGRQYVSWIHAYDFERAVKRLIKIEQLEGAFNICAPHPLPNADFMYHLRRAWGAYIGIPLSAGMLEFGAKLIQIETEHILKSRRVIPARLLKSGFEFVFPTWPKASEDLVAEWRRKHARVRTE